ncbi:putative hydrolase [Gordonia araii NBRC 100433]|uniref:Putative hydrolase n=2 Tax=Gordonia araii TaxID=263909 RepID=G7GXA7_9ACTN|nr:putative hydrolase [Gordonia araii NBRC 100433]
MDDGCELFVTEEGPADAVATIVALHGLSLTSQVFEDVTARLVAAANVRVIAYDARGHGGSGRDEPDLERLADDLAHVVRRLVPSGPLVLVGHSLGGMTMLALAQRHPELVAERVSGAVFVASTPGGVAAAVRRLPGASAAIKLMQAVVRRASIPRHPRVVLRQFARFAFGSGPSVDHLRRTLDQSRQAHMPAVASLVGSILEHERLAHVPAYGNARVTILSGAKDKFFPLAHGRAMAQAVPAARLIEYRTGGHMLPFEQAADVALQILGVVAEAAPANVIDAQLVEELG